MLLQPEQESLIHHALHSSANYIAINDEIIMIEIGQGNKRYLQYRTTTYEKATASSPGLAGELIKEDQEVTICITTGKPWCLLVNGKEKRL